MPKFGGPFKRTRQPFGAAISGFVPPSAVSFALNAGNVITNPDAFDNASWTKDGVTVTADQSAAPNGTTTMDLVVPSTANASHRITSNSFTISGPMTISFIAKASGYTKLALREDLASGSYASFDLSAATVLGSGSVGGFTVTSPTITLLSAGIYRVSMVLTPPSTQGIDVAVWSLAPAYTTGDPTATWAGDGASGIYLWHGQAYP